MSISLVFNSHPSFHLTGLNNPPGLVVIVVVSNDDFKDDGGYGYLPSYVVDVAVNQPTGKFSVEVGILQDGHLKINPEPLGKNYCHNTQE